MVPRDIRFHLSGLNIAAGCVRLSSVWQTRKPRPRPDINVVSRLGNYEDMTSLPQLEDSCYRLLFSSSNFILIILIVTTTSIGLTTLIFSTNIYNMASSSESREPIDQRVLSSDKLPTNLSNMASSSDSRELIDQSMLTSDNLPTNLSNVASSSESREPINQSMLSSDNLPTNISHMASSSQFGRTIDQSMLCRDNTQRIEGHEACYWGIGDGNRGGDCKHPVVRLIDSCSTMDSQINTYCRKTKMEVDVLQADLAAAKKALKVCAFYDWVWGQMGATSQSAAENDKNTGPPLSKIRENFGFTEEFRRLRRAFPKYFGYYGGMTLDRQKINFEKFVQDYEGSGSGASRSVGKIAFVLNKRMVRKAKTRNLWSEGETVIDFYSRTIPGPCHPIYCPSIPIDKLSAAAKIDLAGGSIIPGIEWAFEEPTAQPDAVPGQN